MTIYKCDFCGGSMKSDKPRWTVFSSCSKASHDILVELSVRTSKEKTCLCHNCAAKAAEQLYSELIANIRYKKQVM